MRKLSLNILFSLLLIQIGTGQISAPEILAAQDSIFVELDETNQIIYKHKVQPKQTIYRLARTFGCDPTLLFHINNLAQDSTIKINQEIIVPISSKYIDKSVTAPSSKAIAVYYKVKRSETAYNLSRHGFHQPIENLIARNKMKDFSLALNQALQIGWMSFEWNENRTIIESNNNLVKSKQKPIDISKTPIAEGAEESEEDFFEDFEGMKFVKIMTPEIDSITGLQKGFNLNDTIYTNLKPIKSRGIAKWNRNGTDTENLFVMHRKARINSLIELRNPMNDRKVYARVVGHIQENMVKKEVKIILSPGVAHALGILDKRAQVEMTYFEEM